MQSKFIEMGQCVQWHSSPSQFVSIAFHWHHFLFHSVFDSGNRSVTEGQNTLCLPKEWKKTARPHFMPSQNERASFVGSSCSTLMHDQLVVIEAIPLISSPSHFVSSFFMVPFALANSNRISSFKPFGWCKVKEGPRNCACCVLQRATKFRL